MKFSIKLIPPGYLLGGISLYNENHAMVAWFKRGLPMNRHKSKVYRKVNYFEILQYSTNNLLESPPLEGKVGFAEQNSDEVVM